MELKNQTTKQLRQRKFFMILPLLTLPFITLMFWALGGGKGGEVNAQTNLHAGINLKLPDAKFKDDKHFDKLSFYQQATLDSAKAKEAEKLDPYWNNAFNHFKDSQVEAERFSLSDGSSSGMTDYGMDANKRKVYDKLAELKEALNNSRASVNNNNNKAGSNQYSMLSYSSSNEAARMQAMMQKMKDEKSEDPEITQLNSMLDKIAAIQNPDQAIETNKKMSTGKSLSVKTKKQNASVSLLKPEAAKISLNDTTIETIAANRFYSDVAFNSNVDSTSDNAIGAIIPETQTLVAGATIKLVLTNDVMINDVMLPSGSLIYGTTSLSNERLKITVSSIRFQNSILPVSLEVYDMDGQQGIHVPGSINRTVAKESANNAMSGIGTTTIDPSLGAQAASAGIEAAKTLMTKKVKLVKMTIKAGYKVLLRDSHYK